jgi:hypothetical protein
MEIGDACTTDVNEATRSGRRPKASGSGPTHRGAVPFASGRTNQRSFSSKEAAATAGAAVKKAYPIVMVTIVDTEDGTIEVIKA